MDGYEARQGRERERLSISGRLSASLELKHTFDVPIIEDSGPPNTNKHCKVKQIHIIVVSLRMYKVFIVWGLFQCINQLKDKTSKLIFLFFCMLVD